jgi:hypothetical protein
LQLVAAVVVATELRAHPLLAEVEEVAERLQSQAIFPLTPLLGTPCK